MYTRKLEVVHKEVGGYLTKTIIVMVVVTINIIIIITIDFEVNITQKHTQSTIRITSVF